MYMVDSDDTHGHLRCYFTVSMSMAYTMLFLSTKLDNIITGYLTALIREL